MKGLMVTLLVVFGSGSSLAQQFSGNDFSADRTNRSANSNTGLRTNQTRMQPLTRSFDRTSMRVAQSSSTSNDGFSPTSTQTIGGTDYEDGASTPSRVVPVTASDRNQNNGFGGQSNRGVQANRGVQGNRGVQSNRGVQANRGVQQSNDMVRQSNSPLDTGRGFPSNQTSQVGSNPTSDRMRSDSMGQGSASSQSNSQLRAWPLPVSPEWERTLKAEGYIYAPIKPQEQNSIGEVVMFQDNSQFGNRSGTGSNVSANQWDIYKNTAIIDVDDFSLQEIQKRTLTLRNLGVENLTGVALRYVRDNGNKIDARLIGNIPGNASSGQVTTSNGSVGNQPVVNRGTRPQERQFNTSGQRDVSFSDRSPRQGFDSQVRDTGNNGGWDVNDNQRIRQPGQARQTYQFDDRSVSQRDSFDRFGDDRDRFGADNRDFSRSNGSRLSDDYLDGLRRQGVDERDQRNVDYVRNRINQNRRDEYPSRSDARFSSYQNDMRANNDQYSRSNRVSDSRREDRSSGYDGRSSDYDANFALQQRKLQERLLDAKLLEVKNAEDSAWLKHQRESMEQARIARFYEDDLTPLRRRSNASNDYINTPYGFGADRLADRSTDPNYNGRRTDALSPARASNASADRVAQILAEKEADLDAKMGAIDHLLKLDSAGRKLDEKISSIKNAGQTNNNSRGRVQSLVTVPNTLGGDLAAPRYDRLASNSITNGTRYDGLNGGAPPLDINGHSRRGLRTGGSPAFSNEPPHGGAGDGRMLRLMWLLLLISLGANVYLAMLSRSFYTQYEELADELRETFSTPTSTSRSTTSSRPSPRPRPRPRPTSPSV